MGAGLLGEGEEVIAVAGAHRLRLAGLGEALEPVLAHGLEQAVADLRVPVLGDHQRLVDQRAEQVEHVLALDPLAGADLLGRLEGKAAGEHGEAAKQRPLVVGEQLMAPVDRGAQGLEPRRWRCAARRSGGGSDPRGPLAICSTESIRTRAAASSIASGSPSSSVQI